MQDKTKSARVQELCTIILGTVKSIESETTGSYFDYDEAIKMLEQVDEYIDNTIRYPRPSWLPEGSSWDEAPSDGEDFAPFIYTGTMSVEDYERASQKCIATMNEDEDWER